MQISLNTTSSTLNPLSFIDVGQSVEHEHQNAVEFLKKDCINITQFFRRAGVLVMSPRQLFDFVVDPSINDSNIDDYLEKMQENLLKASETSSSTISSRHHTDDEEDRVWAGAYIPRTLEQIKSITEDYAAASQGDNKNIFYAAITGLKSDLSGPLQLPEILDNSDSADSDDNSQSDDDQNPDSHVDESPDGSDTNNILDQNGKMISSEDYSLQEYTELEGQQLVEELAHCDLGNPLTHQQKKNLPKDQRKKLLKANRKVIKRFQAEKRKSKVPKKVKKRKKKLVKQRNRIK